MNRPNWRFASGHPLRTVYTGFLNLEPWPQSQAFRVMLSPRVFRGNQIHSSKPVREARRVFGAHTLKIFSSNLLTLD